MAEPRRRPGRPRDASISERALAATRELLVQRGFDATTIQAVAEHSGVHASAIYRRWPSRIELIEEATFPGLNPLSVQPTGDLRRDLRRFIRAYLAAFSAPAARAAAAGLFAHYQTSSHLRPPELYLRVSARPQFQDILRAAPPGSIDPAVDPDDVFDMLLGAVLTRTLLFAVTARRRPIERTVEMILRLLRPSDRSLDRPCDDRHWPPRLPAWRRLDGGSGGRRLGLGQLEEASCQEYTEFLTQWASSSMGFETTVRRVSELPGLVYLEIEERHTRAGNIAVVNSLSVYEFNEAGQIRHLDVYLQQPR